MGFIRTLLAISVLITHSKVIFGHMLLGGDQAITCFYVISGFLMTLILSETYHDKKAFYINRALRIFPAFWVALVFNIIVLNALPSSAYNAVPMIERVTEAGGIGAMLYALIANAFLFFGELGRYLAIDMNTGATGLFASVDMARKANHVAFQSLLIVPQAWTLSIELQFYLFVPLLVCLRGGILGLIAGGGMFVAMSVYTQIRRSGVELDPSAVSLFQFPYFILGMSAYWAYRQFAESNLEVAVKHRIGQVAFLCALVLIATGYYAEKHGWLHYNAVYVLFACCVPFIFHLTKHSKIDSQIGELSYPIYLFHFGVSMCVYQFVGADGYWGEMTLLATLVVSYLYIRVIDRRIQQLRRAIASRQRQRQFAMQDAH